MINHKLASLKFSLIITIGLFLPLIISYWGRPVSAAQLSGVAMAQSSNYLFLANSNNGKLLVFNNSGPEAGTLVQTITLGNAPSDLLINGDKLYVALSGSRLIKVINKNTLEVVGELSAPKMPFDLAIDGNLLWSTVSRNNGADYKPFVFYLDPDGLSATSAVGEWTGGQSLVGNEQILINPNNHMAYIAGSGYSPDNIQKFNLSIPASVVFVGQNAHGALGSNGREMNFSADYSKIYYSTGSGGNSSAGYSVVVVNPDDLTKTASMVIGAYPNANAVYGGLLYAGKEAYYDANDVSVFDGNNVPIKTYSLPNNESLVARGISAGPGLFAATNKFLYSLDQEGNQYHQIYNFVTDQIVVPQDEDLYEGDGTYDLVAGDRVKLNNGVIVEPIYTETGVEPYDFKNVAFKVYDSDSNYLGITEITRVGWQPLVATLGGHRFEVFVFSLGTNVGTWFSKIAFVSNNSAQCNHWIYSSWGNCVMNSQHRTIVSLSQNCQSNNSATNLSRPCSTVVITPTSTMPTSTIPASTTNPIITPTSTIPTSSVNDIIDHPVTPHDPLVIFTNQAKSLWDGRIDQLLSEIKQLRSQLLEQAAELKYLKAFTSEMRGLTSDMQMAIKTFITYGVDDNTIKLGEGERAAVISSYKAAFNKLPQTEAELTDTIKIANGRFPTITSNKAEQKAKEQFYKIYKRVADLSDANDTAAIQVMAYGLRQQAKNRNLNSEKLGIKTFKNIYGYNPKTTEDWNIMQAITYSGATRKIDSDKDGLADETEIKLGTDLNNPDSDGDGYKDGIEVLMGYDPLKR